MSEKIRTTIYLDPEVAKEAQELGLNISKTCENALKLVIQQLRPIYKHNNPKNSSKTAKNNPVVGWVGFEPATAGDISRNSPSFFLSFTDSSFLELCQQSNNLDDSSIQ